MLNIKCTFENDRLIFWPQLDCEASPYKPLKESKRRGSRLSSTSYCFAIALLVNEHLSVKLLNAYGSVIYKK